MASYKTIKKGGRTYHKRASGQVVRVPLKRTGPVSSTYDPMAPLDQQQIESQAMSQAKSQVQPALDSIAGDQRTEDSRHATRSGEQTAWYGGLQNQLDKAFGDTTSALNNLIALGGTASGQDSATLKAALDAGNSSVSSAAAQMGGGTPVPNSAEDEIMSAALANSQNQRNFVNATSQGNLVRSGADRGLAAIGRAEAGRGEQARYDAANQELKNSRTDAGNQLSGYLSTARENIRQNELQKQQAGFQQKLAAKQLGISEKQLALQGQNQAFQQDLSNRQLGETVDSRKAQNTIDWANVGINQKQADAQLAGITKDIRDAKTKAGKDRAILRAKQWNAGHDRLQELLAPQPGEGAAGDLHPTVTDKSGKPQLDDNGNPLPLRPFVRKFDDAFRALTVDAGMSKSDALRLLTGSESFPSWRSRAKSELNNLKRRGRRRSADQERADMLKKGLKAPLKPLTKTPPKPKK